MRETIELKKRTPSEREAYIQGMTAGIRMGASSKQMAIIVQLQTVFSSSDAIKLREDIEGQMQTGLVMLDPQVKFCGTIPADSNIDVIVKHVKEAER